GGGVLGDLGGFCAGTLLRGIDFIQVPTTLLAMVDSSVGGKTGINAAVGKNLIGVFYQPRLVLADLSLLATLPQVEVSAGIAEIIKYGAIMDGAFFSYLEDNMAGLKKREPSILRHAVERSVAMKAAVVSGDEKEQRPDGGRMLLNFGHTFAHAIEAELHYRPLARGGILHGQAVGFGMLLAAHFSEYLGVGQHLVPRLKKLLQAASLPTSFADLPPLSKTGWRAERLLAHMYHDKKVSGQQLVFVLLESLGRAVVQRGVAATDLVQFLQKHYL
ncbi:MAG: 3-dehydroquinate synthase, partial [Alphaproteobacteria bacterium]|nr:3-dehydroquinate synthase [Alphaproteobacteria bacterium]